MKYLGIYLAAAALTAPSFAMAEIIETEVHSYTAVDNAVIEGATARLVSTEEGIAGELSTKDLEPGHVYTMWVAIMNQPENCELTTADHCTSSDVIGRAEAVDSDVTYGDGMVASSDGTATFRTFVPAGDLSASWLGNALKDPTGAEIHFALHDHGPAIEDQLAAMLTTARAGCADDSLPEMWPDAARADGSAGPNACQMAQFAVFKQK